MHWKISFHKDSRSSSQQPQVPSPPCSYIEDLLVLQVLASFVGGRAALLCCREEELVRTGSELHLLET
ncbi:hypothetical protein Mapa_003775 [Marchantia paleacea]|nr:hypothetical protein Mapa_003775 [Marchantia paleacea]